MAKADINKVMKAVDALRKINPTISKKKGAEIIGGIQKDLPKVDLNSEILSRLGSAGKKAAPVAAAGVGAAALLKGDTAEDNVSLFDRNRKAIDRAEEAGTVDKPVNLFDRARSKIREKEAAGVLNTASEKSLFQRAGEKIKEKAASGDISAVDVAPKGIQTELPQDVKVTEVKPAIPLPQEVKNAPAALPQEVKKTDATDLYKETEPNILAAALLGAIPTALGAAFGGWEGGARGAAVGEKTVGGYLSKIDERNKLNRTAAMEQAAKAQEYAQREKEIGLRSTAEKEQTDMQIKAKEKEIAAAGEQKRLDRQLQENIAKMRARVATLLASYKSDKSGGRVLPGGVATSIAELRAGLDAGEGLINYVNGVRDKMGPIFGKKAKVPILGAYADQASIQSMLDSHRQFLGKAAEGGVLRKDDWDKYGILLPTVEDTPDKAIQKIQTNNSIIKNLLDQKLIAYGQAGYNVGSFMNPESVPNGSRSVSESEILDRFLEATE